MSNESLRARLAKIEGLKTGTELLRERAARMPPAENELPGTEVENNFGTYRLAEKRFALDVMHGDYAVGRLLEVPPENVALAARVEGEGLDWRRAIFLDTETTSLESGAGIHVFMIGVGFFEADAFVVRQYFMRNPAEEVAMLHDLGACFARFDTAVSFFGKNFDLPRMSDRFNLNRMPMHFPGRHIDLCHAGRRLWKWRFANCQLQTLERGILKFVRKRDLPGADCPAVYFAYQRGLPSRIADLFEHNLWDVVSMAGLTWRIDREMAGSASAITQANVARIFAESGDVDRAIDLYEQARGALWPPKERTRKAAVEMMKNLSKLYWKMGKVDRATMLWQELVDRNQGGAFPHERLAIYYEHHENDWAMALEHATVAFVWAQSEGPPSACEAALRRVARLEAKTGDA